MKILAVLSLLVLAGCQVESVCLPGESTIRLQGYSVGCA